MKTIGVLAITLPTTPATRAQLPAAEGPKPVAAIGLVEAVGAALSRHPDIARALAEQARAGADLGAARSQWLPTLSYEANIEPDALSGSRLAGFNEAPAGAGLILDQLVWDFGRTRAQIRAAGATERQRTHELEQTADRLAEEVAQAFLDARRLERLDEAGNRHVAALERLRHLIGLRAAAGISDRSDLMLAEVRVEGARGELVQNGTALGAAAIRLANLTGVMPGRHADPAAVLSRLPPAGDGADLAALPAVAAARAAADSAAARIGQARAERFPRLGLRVSYGRSLYEDPNRNRGVTALMTVGGRLFQPGHRQMIRAAEADRRAAIATTDSVLLEARGRALAAQAEIRGGTARIDAYRVQEARAEQASRIFLEEYKIGQRSLSDLLNAQLEIHRAAAARIAAEHDIARARIQYEAALGRLRPALGLAARVPQ